MNIIFPAVDQADENGLLAIGGSLTVESLRTAYLSGIFPWPMSEEYPITWFSPDPRGVLLFDNFKVSTSFKKFLKKTTLTVRFNTCFEEVINRCANVRRSSQDDTWITDELLQAYVKLFEAGHAYSVETYNRDKLVGGLYGVCFGEMFSGESMFFEEDNASKLALYILINKLKDKARYIDTQMVTPVLESFGAIEIDRQDYIKLLGSLDINKPRSYFLD
jgi:leucyl/phenylalanyl-tRNA--protein transferase